MYISGNQGKRRLIYMDIISHCVNRKLNVVVVAARDILKLFLSNFDRMSCHYSLIQSWISFHAITREVTPHLMYCRPHQEEAWKVLLHNSKLLSQFTKWQWNNTACDIKHICHYLICRVYNSTTENNVFSN